MATINGTTGDDNLVGTSDNDTINGLGGNDTLIGNSGDDSLDGGDGADSLLGGEGNDTLISGFEDTVDGGGGFDTQIMPGGIAGAGIERIILRGYPRVGADGHGNELDNIIIDEGPGNAFLYGNAGNDTLIGGAGFNVFVFTGNPSGVSSAYGHDSVDGGGGVDWLFFENNSSAVTIDFRAGTVSGGSPVPGSVTFVNVERAVGSLFDDVIIAGDGGNGLSGYGGDDTLTGGAGADSLTGDSGFDHPPVDPGNDRLFGGGGNDVINGEEADDWIDGGSGNDQLLGGEGADRFAFTVEPGAPNADTLNDFVSADDQITLEGFVHANLGPSGPFTAGDARFAADSTGIARDSDDRVVYNTSTGELWYDADGNGAAARQLIALLNGAPTLAATDIEVLRGSSAGGQTINGSSGNDTLIGTSGNDTIYGLDGNDLFLAGSTGGVDVLDGGACFDSIEFKERATGALVVDYGAGTISGGISFTNIERVVTGNFSDSLSGNASAQTLTGQGGADTLWGAGAIDTLWGGGGADSFVFREMGTANADLIRDWASGLDKVALDDSVFSAIGATGNFAAGDARFAAGAGFASGGDASDRVLFDTSTGRLYYDADGSESAAAQLVATLQSGATVVATDIVVI